MNSKTIRSARANATQAGLQAAMWWVQWCKNNGWSEQSLPKLEELWWKYHNENGELSCPGPSKEVQERAQPRI